MTEVDKKVPEWLSHRSSNAESPTPLRQCRRSLVLRTALRPSRTRLSSHGICSLRGYNIELEAARAMFRPPKYDLRLFNFSSKHGWWSKFQSWRRPHSYMFSEAFVRESKEVL